MSRHSIAIILGRAGSKGVPGKNMRPLAGKPCAAWTIEHALQSRGVKHVIVSSDDDALRNLAQRMGAIAFDRSSELAGDTATIDAAARDALSRYEQQHAALAHDDPIVILYANVPVRPADLADHAIELFKHDAGNVDSVQSFSRVGKHHPWWMVRVDEKNGSLTPWQDETHGLFHGVFRRQDLPPAFVPDGGVMVVSRAALTLGIPNVAPGPHAFLGRPERRRGIITDGDVIDIDSPTDLLVAEAVLTPQSCGTGVGRAPVSTSSTNPERGP